MRVSNEHTPGGNSRIVFLSYRRDDDPVENPGDDGKVGQFSRDLQNRFDFMLGPERPEVFFDRDERNVIGTDPWRQKILNKLANTTVLISIVGANYLSQEENKGCRWELDEYRKLCLAPSSLPRTIYTITICPEFVKNEKFRSGNWDFLETQEIMSGAMKAWNVGPGSSQWQALAAQTAEIVTNFVGTKTVPVGGISLIGQPVVGTPASWRVDEETLSDAVRATTQWYLNGNLILGATEPMYIPTQGDEGKLLSARVKFVRDGFHTSWRETDPVPVLLPMASIGRVAVECVDGSLLQASAHDVIPQWAEDSVAFQWQRDKHDIGVPGAIHRLGKADVGHNLRVRATVAPIGFIRTEKYSEENPMQIAQLPRAIEEEKQVLFQDAHQAFGAAEAAKISSDSRSESLSSSQSLSVEKDSDGTNEASLAESTAEIEVHRLDESQLKREKDDLQNARSDTKDMRPQLAKVGWWGHGFVALLAWAGWVLSMSQVRDNLWWLTGSIGLFIIGFCWSCVLMSFFDDAAKLLQDYGWNHPNQPMAPSIFTVVVGVLAVVYRGAPPISVWTNWDTWWQWSRLWWVVIAYTGILWIQTIVLSRRAVITARNRNSIAQDQQKMEKALSKAK